MKKKSFTTLLWISIAVGMFFFIFFTAEKNQTVHNALLSVAVAFMYSFVLSLGNGFVNEFLNKRYSWTENTKARVITGIIGSLLVNAGLVLACNYVNFILVQKMDPAKFFKGGMAVSNWVIINITLLIAAILHAKGFMEEWKKSAKQQVTEQKIIAKSANAQFESLKNQLDPHFLFNSLNVLDALIEEDPQQAQRFTASMSKVYRYVLDQKDKELVTVEEELDFAKTYCDLLKTRFEDAVEFEVEVEEEAKKMFVVPLSLQLLLENAVKHNFATSAKPLKIKIYSENGQLIIENNLQKRETVQEREGIGLSNIVQRYSLLTKENVRIEESAENFKVKIPILNEKITAMKTTFETQDQAYIKASARVTELKKFYFSLIAYCVTIPFFFLVNYFTSRNDWWFQWPALGWGVGLAIQAVRVFGINKNWEEKKIQEILNKQN